MLFSNAAFAQTGEVIQGNSTIGPVFDSATGDTVFVRQALGAPMPVNSNVNSMAPVYVVVYPLQSTIPADSLQCQPTNCDHLNVLPFYDPTNKYAEGSDAQCQQWNGGSPCSLVKGHFHLFGVASDGGDFTVPHYVKLAIFTPQAFSECLTNADCAMNKAVSTLAQMWALVDSGDLVVGDTPITVNLSVVPERTYELGTPTVIPFV
jgi:hypothetical protein